MKNKGNIKRSLNEGIRPFTISLLVIWLASGVIAGLESNEQAQDILTDLLNANRILLDSNQGRIEAVFTEHVLPKTTDENAIKTRSEREFERFRELQAKNPQPEKVRFDLELAIPFNTRYDLMNESTTKSRISYRWQGDKYYYDMEVLDRQDSIKPSPELKELGTTHVFMTKWNGQRIFTFDETKAVNYFKSARAVHIQKDRLRLQNPRVWGIPSVMGQSVDLQKVNEFIWSTQPVEINNKPHQELLGESSEGQWIRVIFDPGYETRPLHVEYQDEHRAAVAHYWNYEQIAGQWFPKKIFLQLYRIEVNPDTGQTTRRLSRELTWEIEQVDPAPVFGPDSFKPDLQPGDRVIDFRYNPPFQYIHADPEIEQAVIDELALIKTNYFQELTSAGRPTEQVSAPQPKAKLASASITVKLDKKVTDNKADSKQAALAAQAGTDFPDSAWFQSTFLPALVIAGLGVSGILLGRYYRRKETRT